MIVTSVNVPSPLFRYREIFPEIGHVQIRVAIVVVICGNAAHPVAGVSYACCCSNIGKYPGPVVLIEAVLWVGQLFQSRAAVRR